ncbi:4-phosphoerythronate dehydrogenase [Marinomonas pollencensis]|uniref:Erythronate-4-phosphate dehydrogenase n=2 Tax=Marinomonas pollencensis TaxID=491954 RepID=A0A3E0DRK2_9GAMM|nr:4-phosphoerythronate dehydrogenase [Marinomonas pollencensis]
MPNVAALFTPFAEVELVNGRALTNEQVKHADALLVRSVTKVNEALLAGSNVRFVGSATIGVDHIDTEYLCQQGIHFTSAPGCNAAAVADYVLSALGYLSLTKNLSWLGKKVGIIGYGNVGKTVYQRFQGLGCDVCVYDPYKEQEVKVDAPNFVSLDAVLRCAVISLHAPFTTTGAYPTQGMISAEQLSAVTAGTTIISAGRGGVIDEAALVDLHDRLAGQLNLVLDVWRGEPEIDLTTLSIADIATPHIAGYSKQGREKGTWMVYQAFCHFFDMPAPVTVNDAITNGRIAALAIEDSPLTEELLARAMHAIYDVARDDARLRAHYRAGANKATFDWLRKHYVERDEFNTCVVSSRGRADLNALSAIGFQVE